jgi:hypothetical protein
MASIRQRRSRYTVTWRDEHGKQRGTTVGSKREATKIKRELERHDTLWQRTADSMTVSAAKSGRIQRRQSAAGPPPKTARGKLTVAGYANDWLAGKPLSDAGEGSM